MGANQGFDGKSKHGGAAKPRRHPAFGCLKDVTKVPPGVDLTEPACPEWADIIEEKYGPKVGERRKDEEWP